MLKHTVAQKVQWDKQKYHNSRFGFTVYNSGLHFLNGPINQLVLLKHTAYNVFFLLSQLFLPLTIFLSQYSILILFVMTYTVF